MRIEPLDAERARRRLRALRDLHRRHDRAVDAAAGGPLADSAEVKRLKVERLAARDEIAALERLLEGSAVPRPAPCPLETLEEETRDAPLARRNLLLGLWAGRCLGLGGGALAAYAREVMAADLVEPGEADIVAKVAGDLGRGGLPVPAPDVLRELRRHHADAYRHFAATD